MTVAMFDMDHTVLNVDSSMSWMRFLRRKGELSPLFVARAMVWGVQYKFALLDLDALADRVVGNMRGDSEHEMLTRAKEWHRTDLAPNVAADAKRVIADHRKRGDTVVLLTGSSQYAAKNVAAALDIEHVLCTELEVESGHFTGRVAQRCFGPHKVEVAERWAAAHGVDLDEAVFYSDSYNDLPMLSRVARPIAVNPDVRLRRHAEARGWTIASWQ